MDGYINTCTRATPRDTRATPEMIRAAETLACMLLDAAEFQNYVRLERAMHLDEDVMTILARLNGYDEEEVTEASNFKALEDQLEALPVVREYRQAELAARAIFSAVEEAIIGAAGVAFAEHARPSACS